MKKTSTHSKQILRAIQPEDTHNMSNHTTTTNKHYNIRWNDKLSRSRFTNNNVSNLTVNQRYKQQLKQINQRIDSMRKQRKFASQNDQPIEKHNRNLQVLEAQKKILMERHDRKEYDYYCRGQRKFQTLQIIPDMIQHNNDSNIPQRKRILKALNKERKKEYNQQILIRDRLREIITKYGDMMQRNC